MLDTLAKPVPQDKIIDFCEVTETLYVLLLFQSVLVKFNVFSLRVEEEFDNPAKNPTRIVSLCPTNFVIVHETNHLSFFTLKKSMRFINRLSTENRVIKLVQSFSPRVLCVADDRGTFYIIHKCRIKKVYLVRTSFDPIPGHLVKGFYLLARSDHALFWGYTNDFLLYFSTECISHWKKITVHANEILKVEYFPSREAFVSVDTKGAVTIWSARNFHKY